MNERINLSPNGEVILAVKAFDVGSGFSTLDCESSANEPDRIENAACWRLQRI